MAAAESERTKWWQFVLALLALAIGVGLTILFLLGAWKLVVKAPEVFAALAAGLLSVASVLLSKLWERKRSIEEEHRRQKLPVYEDFMTFWFRMLLSENLALPSVSQREMAEFNARFIQKLMLWGSDSVLHEYSQFRRSIDAAEENPIGMVALFEGVLYAIRRDVGHKNKDLGAKDLLRLWINDIDSVVASVEATEDSA